MAKPIKETPVLRGSEASRFLQEVKANEQKDHSASYARARNAFDMFATKLPGAGHAATYAR